MTIHWKAVEQCFTVMLFGCRFYSVCSFAKFINFVLKLSARVKGLKIRKEKMRMCKIKPEQTKEHGERSPGVIPQSPTKNSINTDVISSHSGFTPGFTLNRSDSEFTLNFTVANLPYRPCG